MPQTYALSIPEGQMCSSGVQCKCLPMLVEQPRGKEFRQHRQALYSDLTWPLSRDFTVKTLNICFGFVLHFLHLPSSMHAAIQTRHQKMNEQIIFTGGNGLKQHYVTFSPFNSCFWNHSDSIVSCKGVNSVSVSATTLSYHLLCSNFSERVGINSHVM